PHFWAVPLQRGGCRSMSRWSHGGVMRRLRIFLFGLLATGMYSAGPARAGSWIPKGPPGTPIVSLAVDPLDPDIIYAGTESGGEVFKSTDGGELWVRASTGLPFFGGYRLAIDPDTPTTVWSAIQFGDLSSVYVKSDDAAGNWLIQAYCVIPFPQTLGVLGGDVVAAGF